MAENTPSKTAKTTSDSDTRSSEGLKRKRRWVTALFLLVCGLAALGVWYYLESRNYVDTDDAYVEATVVHVSPRVAGQIISVRVKDNEHVEAGDLIAEIDPAPYQAQLDQALASLALAQQQYRTAHLTVTLTGATSDASIEQARAEVSAAEAAVEEARAEVTAAQAEAERAQKDAQRYEALSTSAVSRQQKDLADATARAAEARLAAAEKGVASAVAQVGAAKGRLAAAQTAPHELAVRRSEVSQRDADIQKAEAAVREAQLDLSYTKIYAAIAGRVTRKSVDPGDYVQVGQDLLALVSDDVYVVANFKETQLTDMKPGQKAEVSVDAYPDITLKGHVDSIQAGTGSRFSLFPPENATGNFVKVVQRVPVKIVFDNPPPDHVFLAPGMSVIPTVYVR